MIHVQCNGCGKWAVSSEPGVDVHELADSSGCTCCTQDHYHGSVAEGAAPCRPVTVTFLPGSARVNPAEVPA